MSTRSLGPQNHFLVGPDHDHLHSSRKDAAKKQVREGVSALCYMSFKTQRAWILYRMERPPNMP